MILIQSQGLAYLQHMASIHGAAQTSIMCLKTFERQVKPIFHLKNQAQSAANDF
jgi:hypothetical protein